jgi:hypothetical protein
VTPTALWVLAIGFVVAFANGANDVSKGIATLVGSGLTDYRRAIQWGALWTALGALAGAPGRRGHRDHLRQGLPGCLAPQPTLAAAAATLVGAALWVLLANRAGSAGVHDPRHRRRAGRRRRRRPTGSTGCSWTHDRSQDRASPWSRPRSSRCCSPRPGSRCRGAQVSPEVRTSACAWGGEPAEAALTAGTGAAVAAGSRAQSSPAERPASARTTRPAGRQPHAVAAALADQRGHVLRARRERRTQDRGAGPGCVRGRAGVGASAAPSAFGSRGRRHGARQRRSAGAA